jgi:hypothetical protein
MQQILAITTRLFHRTLAIEFLFSDELTLPPLLDPKGYKVCALHDLTLTALLQSQPDHAFDWDMVY